MREALPYFTAALIAGGTCIGLARRARNPLIRGACMALLFILFGAFELYRHSPGVAMAALIPVAIFMLLERVLPRNDYRFLSDEALQNASILLLYVATITWVGRIFPLNTLPSLRLRHQMPLWAQIAVFMLLSDLLIYSIHRVQHSRFFWPFHKLHHATEEMNVLAGFRNNLYEHAILRSMTRIALMQMLGVSGQAFWITITIANVFSGPIAHANIDFPPRRMRWINYLFVTPNFHGTHHTPSGEACNFGNSFTLWDALFGTFRNPESKPTEFGVKDKQFARQNLIIQHWLPFRKWALKLKGLKVRSA